MSNKISKIMVSGRGDIYIHSISTTRFGELIQFWYIGKIFLNLIKKHFPPHHKFHKLFNKNTVKISYSCTRNIKSIINSHNAKILFPNKNTEQ